MNIVSAPVQQLPEAQSVTNDDYILTFNALDGKARKALAALFHFGTTDYDALSHKPSINGEALSGNKTAADLGLVASAEGKGLSTNDFTDTEKSKLSGIEEQANKTLIDDTLSNAGQAADAKATGGAFSVLQAENALLKELINGIDAPIYRTASGNPATFSDGYAADVKELIVTLAPSQEGEGDPYPPGGGAQILRGTNDNSELGAGDSGYSWAMEKWRKYSTGTGTRERFAVSDPPADGILYGFHLIKTDATANGIVGIAQNGVPYKAQTLTISFYAKGAGGRIRTGLSTPLYGYLTIPASNVWTRYAVSITPTDKGNATFNFGLQDENTEIYVCGLMMEYGEEPSAWSDYSNIRPISGVSSVTVTRTGENGANPASVTVPLVDSDSAPLAVYGGTLDVTTGELTVTHGNIASYNGEALPGIWISDRDVYAAGTSPTTGAQVVYELAAPVAYTLTPAQIATLSGYNTISADAGTLSVTYRADPSISLGGG